MEINQMKELLKVGQQLISIPMDKYDELICAKTTANLLFKLSKNLKAYELEAVFKALTNEDRTDAE